MVESQVCFRQRKSLNRCSNRNLRGQSKEFFSIAPRQIGYGTQLAFLPQQRIGKTWDLTHMDAAAADNSAFSDRFQSHWDELACRREQDRRIKLFGWGRIRPTGPDRAQGFCKLLSLIVARSSKGIDRARLKIRDLRDNVRRGSKAVNTEALGAAGPQVGAKTDQSRTKQRRRFGVGIRWRYRKTEPLIGNGEFG